jgi:hypothetical protein
MSRYATNNDLGGTKQALAAAYKTLISLTAETATLCGGKLYDLILGAAGTPADNAVEIDVSRQTAVGTSTVVTANSLDPAQRAAGSISEANYTAEGTITANSGLLKFVLNQRASFRWQAVPGSELIWPAVDENGLAVRAKAAAYTGTYDAHALHEE